MTQEELSSCLETVEKKYREILPKKVKDNDLTKIYPLDGILIIKSEEEFNDFKITWYNFLDGLDKFWNKLNHYVSVLD